MYQALYRKWRPKTFDDVVGQQHITETLKRQIASDHTSHAYLFTGTRGTGKTTCAKILSRALNCESPVNGNPCNKCPTCLGIENGSILDVLELDAASNNGVDQIRALRDEAIYSPTSARKRVYIVDEVHMLSISAFNALLKILEEPPEHLVFILATTEVHKIPATIKSRCQQFAFKRLQPEDIIGRLKYVSEQEQLPLTESGATLLARLADGGMRDALSLLDQVSGSGGTIDEAKVLDVLGMTGNLNVSKLLSEIAVHDTEQALLTFDEIYRNGKEVSSLISELTLLVRDLLLRKTAPQGGSSLMIGGYDEQTMNELCQALSVPRMMNILTILQQFSLTIKDSSNVRTDAELCIIQISNEQLASTDSALIARIERLESMLANGITVATAPAKPLMNNLSGTTAASVSSSTGGNQSAKTESVQRAAETTVDTNTVKEPVKPPVSSANENLNSDFVWDIFVKEIKKVFPVGQYPMLADSGKVVGCLVGSQLKLYISDNFTKDLLARQQCTNILKRFIEAKYAVTDASIQYIVGQLPSVMGKVNSEAKKQDDTNTPYDKLNDLLDIGKNFDNIIIN